MSASRRGSLLASRRSTPTCASARPSWLDWRRPVHSARTGGAADRPQGPPGAADPPLRASQTRWRYRRPPNSGFAMATSRGSAPGRSGATSVRSSPTASPSAASARARSQTRPPNRTSSRPPSPPAGGQRPRRGRHRRLRRPRTGGRVMASHTSSPRPTRRARFATRLCGTGVQRRSTYMTTRCEGGTDA